MRRWVLLLAAVVGCVGLMVLALGPDSWGIPFPLRVAAMTITVTSGWWAERVRVLTEKGESE